MSEENRTIGDELEGSEKLDKIKEEFREEPDTVSLNINRVPKYVSDALKSEAQEDWAGDYGMVLTFWFKEKKSLEVMQRQIDALENKIEQLENLLTESLNSDDEENQNEGLKTLNEA